MLIPSGEYPKDWPDIASRIKEAAAWKCERCAKHHDLKNRCILTVHHLDGNKANCEPYNLAALCSPCHLKIHHLFSPYQLAFFPEPPWLQKHIHASPWRTAH